MKEEPVILQAAAVYKAAEGEPTRGQPAEATAIEVNWPVVAGVLINATLLALKLFGKNGDAVDVARLDPQGSTRLSYDTREQRYEVAVTPGWVPPQVKTWEPVVLAHPNVENQVANLLKDMERVTVQALPVVQRTERNRAPLWKEALPQATTGATTTTAPPPPAGFEGVSEQAPTVLQAQVSFTQGLNGSNGGDVGANNPIQQQTQWLQRQANQQRAERYAAQPQRSGGSAQGNAEGYAQAQQARPPMQTALQRLANSVTVPVPATLPQVTEKQTPENDEPKNLWDKLNEGQVLTDKEIKQLFLALQIHSVQQEQQGIMAKIPAMGEAYARHKLVENKVKSLLVDADGYVEFGGVKLPARQAEYFVRQDIEHFIETDMHLPPSAIRAEAGSVSLKSAQTLSKQRLTNDELDKLVTKLISGEKLIGVNSNKPPIEWDRLEGSHQALWHWLHGQGQPVKIPFNSLDFRKGSIDRNQVSSSIKKVNYPPGKHQAIIRGINLNFNDLNTIEGQVLGNISVDLLGPLEVFKDGSWVFYPSIKPTLIQKPEDGKAPFYGDLYNFNKGKRGGLKENLTRTINKIDGTAYRIYFTEEGFGVFEFRGSK